MIRFIEIFFHLNKLCVDYKYNGTDNGFIEGFCELSDLKKNCITWIRDINNFDTKNINLKLNLLIVTNFPQNEKLVQNYNFIMCNEPRSVFLNYLTIFCISKRIKDRI